VLCRYPQDGLSRAISSVSARMACAVRDRPGLRRGYAQRRLTRSACQRSRVRNHNLWTDLRLAENIQPRSFVTDDNGVELIRRDTTLFNPATLFIRHPAITSAPATNDARMDVLRGSLSKLYEISRHSYSV
jgi:hypothetical protein